jgi:hypothetical protein
VKLLEILLILIQQFNIIIIDIRDLWLKIKICLNNRNNNMKFRLKIHFYLNNRKFRLIKIKLIKINKLKIKINQVCLKIKYNLTLHQIRLVNIKILIVHIVHNNNNSIKRIINKINNLEMV